MITPSENAQIKLLDDAFHIEGGTIITICYNYHFLIWRFDPHFFFCCLPLGRGLGSLPSVYTRVVMMTHMLRATVKTISDLKIHEVHRPVIGSGRVLSDHLHHHHYLTIILTTVRTTTMVSSITIS